MRCFIESKVKVMTNGGKVILQAGLIQRSYHQIKGRFNEIRALPMVYQGCDSGRVGGSVRGERRGRSGAGEGET